MAQLFKASLASRVQNLLGLQIHIKSSVIIFAEFCRITAKVHHIFSTKNGSVLVCSTFETPGPGYSKLTTSLVNVSLKFQTLRSEISQYFLLKKCEKLLQCKSFSYFFNKNFSIFGYKSCKTLNELTS